MLLKLVVFTLFACVRGMFYPNILDGSFPCALMLKENMYNFKHSLYSITYEEDIIYFSPCFDLERVRCAKNATVCVKSKNVITNFDKPIINNSSYISLSSEKCKADIILSEEVELKVTKHSDKCEYLLQIPKPNLKSSCTKEIDNRTLVFFQIPEITFDKHKRIALDLCQPSARCKDEMSSVCDITSNTSVSLGLTERRTINYSPITGVEFKFKRERQESIVSLKCNWTTVLGNVRYRAASNIKHLFTVDSYLGCVKFNPNCLVYFENYIYNLTSLNKPDGHKVTNEIGEDIVVNICGPLFSRGLCSEQHSQICRHTNNFEENYGSIMTTISVDNDILKTTLKDGSACPKMTNISLTTNINLICSLKDKSPILKSVSSCSYELHWETPAACPKLNSLISTAAIFKPCFVTKDDITYDLSPLTSNSTNYIVPTSGNVDFIVNICRSVIVDADQQCQPTMGMCSRNNAEPNIRRRFANIGNVHGPSIENDTLVLRFKFGGYSTKCRKDPSAAIFFKCSAIEVGPIFESEKKCEYLFSWQTKHACPKQEECLLKNNLGNTVSLSKLEKQLLKFTTSESKEYTIDICTPNITTQSYGIFENFTTSRTVVNYGEHFYVQYRLNRPCQPENFNVIRIHLKCEVITSNDHYDFGEISNCTQNIDFKHHSFCKVLLNETAQTKPELEIAVTQKTSNKDTINCTYQYQGVEINLNSLKPLTVISSTNRRYTVGINQTGDCRSFICVENEELATLYVCPKAKNDNDELTLSFESHSGLNNIYSVVFRCKKVSGIPKVLLDGSNALFQYPLEEVCFEGQNSNMFYIIGSVACILVIAACLVVYKKELIKRKCFLNSNCKRTTYIYCKNSED